MFTFVNDWLTMLGLPLPLVMFMLCSFGSVVLFASICTLFERLIVFRICIFICKFTILCDVSTLLSLHQTIIWFNLPSFWVVLCFARISMLCTMLCTPTT